MISPRQWIISQKYGKKGAQQIQSQKTKGPQIQPLKVLAGGLLSPGMRVVLKTPLVKKTLKFIKDKTKEQYGAWSRKTSLDKAGPALKKKFGALGKLELKKRKAMFLKKYAHHNLESMYKGRTTASLTAYEKKINEITKAIINKPLKTKLHSTGGEVVIGKNVDKDLL